MADFNARQVQLNELKRKKANDNKEKERIRKQLEEDKLERGLRAQQAQLAKTEATNAGL